MDEYHKDAIDDLDREQKQALTAVFSNFGMRYTIPRRYYPKRARVKTETTDKVVVEIFCHIRHFANRRALFAFLAVILYILIVVNIYGVEALKSPADAEHLRSGERRDQKVANALWFTSFLGYWIAWWFVHNLTRRWVTITITPDDIRFGHYDIPRNVFFGGFRLGSQFQQTDEKGGEINTTDRFGVNRTKQTAFYVAIGAWGEELAFTAPTTLMPAYIVWLNALVEYVGSGQTESFDHDLGWRPQIYHEDAED